MLPTDFPSAPKLLLIIALPIKRTSVPQIARVCSQLTWSQTDVWKLTPQRTYEFFFLERQRSYVPASNHFQQLPLGILAEGAMTLPVTLSGGVLFAS